MVKIHILAFGSKADVEVDFQQFVALSRRTYGRSSLSSGVTFVDIVVPELSRDLSAVARLRPP